eukprot:gnl/MRDRNA2_/MRDRNA2_90034_c0_seq1.p1 gnl/MRDRNA2_/MRDRNA2_90034_c0~~gnl/MRDRNA2_/MRDRNA2_90034_c0_seq1.p1  ORF type:complete len:2893 (+),score=610.94 gnl/MRDRNA2_/MRDRNA2_90034_c0_seq1:209-8680(+)
MVPHAETFKSRFYPDVEIPCKNGVNQYLTTVESLCHVQCLPGYDLADNDIKCSEKGNRLTYSWAQFEGSAECTPKVCGPPPDSDHTRHLFSPVVFPNEAEYNCQLGYTLNQSAAGFKNFEIYCTEEGTFSSLELCEPVKCGKCPTGSEKYAHAVPSQTLMRTYGLPCDYTCDPGYTLDQQAGGETTFRIKCLATGEMEEPPACLPVTCGPPPKIANADIKDVEDTDDPIFFPNEVAYECDKGYTLDELPKDDSNSKFSLKCTKKGTFSEKPLCKPVLCGVPPNVPHSVYPEQALVFKETVTYQCDIGYSLDAKADGKKMETIRCGADGQYMENAPVCKPVECGEVPALENGKTEFTGVANFEDPAIEYKCDPGYSTLSDDDPYDPKSDITVTQCQADGTFKEHPTCKNIQDCHVHLCGPHGSCVDKAEPTDKPFDNYECKCEEGWEETLVESTVRDELSKFCTEINDCPVPLEKNCGDRNAAGMRRGMCTDIHVDYTCSCASGYKMEYLKDKPKNQTCVPLVCGDIEVGEHTSSSLTGEANYDTPPWELTCDKGYTLDGTSAGKTTAKQSCQVDGTFKAAKPCLPVTCGPPLSVDFADMDPKLDEMFFPEEVEYTCEEGYTLNSKADGEFSFKVECKHDGRKTAVRECKPVECGTVPEHSDATYDKQTIFVFQDETYVDCDEGFSTDQTTNPESSKYMLTCQAMGEFTETKECKRIKCPEVPDVEHAKKDDTAKVFEDKAEYTLDKGYTLDGKAGGPTKFTIVCQADATFTDVKEPLPVSCGSAPSKPFSSTPSASYVFPQEVPYTCGEGYSVDAKADGPKEFDLKCEADGTYSGPDGCKPVECGAPEVAPNSKQVANSNGKKRSTLVFKQKGHFECLPGYSLDGVMTGPTKFTTLCTADGSITSHAGCLNMNDCEGNQCGENGKCMDHDSPTGVHKDDYHCDCDSGFDEKVLDDGTRICENVPDCPEGACLPGSCQDLVNDYECNCPEGYYEGENPGEELAHDCLPVKCGTPPTKPNAETDKKGTDIYFAEDPIEYKCEEGYTLDGSAEGDTTFEITCQADKSFSESPECKPVVCGEAPEVENAKYDKDTLWEYPKEIPYSCETGYTVDGKASGDDGFKGKCQADGVIADVKQCLPVECPAIEDQPNAAFPEGAALVFPEKVEVKCVKGFALDKDKHDETKYEIECKADGTLDVPHDGCVPIDCGDAPEIEHTTSEGSTLFGDSLKYTAAHGYSVDGTAEGAKDFLAKCTKDGSFRKQYDAVKLIRCGPPAGVPNAKPGAIDGDFTAESLLQNPLKKLKVMKQKELKNHTSKVRLPRSLARRLARRVAYQARMNKSHIHKANVTHIRHKAKNRRDVMAKYGDVIKYECDEGYGVDENGDGFAEAEEKSEFSMHCQASGEIKPGGSPSAESKLGRVPPFECLPIRCPIPEEGVPSGSEEDPPSEGEVDNKVRQYPVIPEGLEVMPVITFEMKLGFACAAGFSLDGTVNGNTEFEETCEADGKLTAEFKCKDIDWCELSECGENGKCIDGAAGYTCDCDEGFKSTLTDTGLETCVQIDECDTMGGEGLCTENGKCVDETLKYKCECDEGYKNEDDEDGLDTCTPVICGEPPELADATTPLKGIKIPFPDIVPFSCVSGFSLDGTNTGASSFELTCEADKSFSGEKECEAIKCGETETVENAKVNVTELKFPEVAGYTCEKGYTTSGMANGMKKFSVSCTADGMITDVEECKPVRCGKPVAVLFARFPLNSVTFGGKVEYICQEGYTTTGEADGDTKFEVECEETGNFTEAKRCMPVSCGMPEMIAHSVMPIEEFTFPNTFQVACEGGHTVDADPDGESTFVVKCTKSGEFEGLQECKKVTCGPPANTEGAETADGEKFFEENAEWNCKPGYTTDGKPLGLKKFVKQCQADGTYGDSSPNDCIDINFCHGNPCGKNGVCTDLGPGKVDPGYECDCAEGYEVNEGPKGPVCSADDCAGDPCGEGGTCFDLTKREPPGPQGAYTCECEDGYELVEPKEGEYKCIRKICGVVTRLENLEMDVNNDPVIEVQTWKGDEPETDVGTGLPILKSFDSVTYNCKEGFSTDGGTGPESKSFTITCESTGHLERPLNPAKECQPVKCANFMLPTVPHTTVVNAKEGFFEFGDIVKFQCDIGFTLNTQPDGPSEFTMPCQKDGKFPTDHENCKPVTCGVPHEIPNTLRSTTKKITYHEGVTYTCSDGFTIGGEAHNENQFAGQCEANGEIAFFNDDGGEIPEPECEPISCGVPPQIANAMLGQNREGMIDELELIQRNHEMSLEEIIASQNHKRKNMTKLKHKGKGKGKHKMKGKHRSHPHIDVHANLLGRRTKQPGDEYYSYSDEYYSDEGPGMEIGVVRYRDPDVEVMCNDGYSIDGIPGGRFWFTMRCTSEGTFTNTDLKCDEPKFKVQGIATDAQSARIVLKKARIQFTQGEKILADVDTDASGYYTAYIPQGEVTLTASKSGYINQVKQLSITSTIRRGQGADVALSKVLPEDAWRAVVSWDAKSRDIDSHTYFGGGGREHVYWPSRYRDKTAAQTGGIKVVLDRDDVNGFGPETTTFMNVGKCKVKGNCLIKFKIKNYSRRDKPLGDSKVKIVLYNGASVHSKYEILPEVGEAKPSYMHPIFTIDASEGATQKVHEGDYQLPAFISHHQSGQQNWWGSLDHQMRSNLPWGTVLGGLYTTGGNRIFNIEMGYYYKVQNWKEMTCWNENWWGSFDRAGWSSCQTGMYLAGFYRTGHMWDWNQGTYQIEEGRCCKIDGKTSWGTCEEQPILEGSGWSKCRDINGQPSAMVALYRSNQGDIRGIDKAKCCLFP